MRQGLYRVGQFWRSLFDRPTTEGLARAESILTPELLKLFSRMLPFEQAHAIRVMDGLALLGYDDPDVLAAGLLHDVGKVRRALRPWERAVAVAVKRLLPGKYRQWGQGDKKGLRAGIVVVAQHAAWGADMAADAGADRRVVWLIRYHDTDTAQLEGEDRVILDDLQAVDAAN